MRYARTAALLALGGCCYSAAVPEPTVSKALIDGIAFTLSLTCKNAPETRVCWKDGYTIATDKDVHWPNTGKTVSYHFDITETTMALDGVSKMVQVVNGQFPGPLIEADWGDIIEVTVKNSLPVNGTGIHWHGLRQFHTNHMDGANGLTECPIAPGDSRVYRFQATVYGTSWYHSHYSVQYADGIVGPIIIHGPASDNYHVDLGSYILSDWFHAPMWKVNQDAKHAKGAPTADNVLVNGTMLSPDGQLGKYATTTLEPGKKHRLRLINAGINNYFHVSLDGHPFTVIAADFVPIKPFTTTSLVIGVGQRYDVVIDAAQPIGSYWFRTQIGGTPAVPCDGPNRNAANIRGIFRYQGGAAGVVPTSTAYDIPTGCYDEPNIVPFRKATVPKGVPKGLTLGFSQTEAQGNLVRWLINDSAVHINWESPTLQYALDGNTDYPANNNVYIIDQADQWTYWVIQADATNAPIPHPIHLHGHDFYVLGSGPGTFNASSPLNFDNPTRRDSASLPGLGWIVLAFRADNPGAWFMHCHIPFHISAGLGLQFVERPGEIAAALGDVSGFREGCRRWAGYSRRMGGMQHDYGH